jgi:hypothetical protein
MPSVLTKPVRSVPERITDRDWSVTDISTAASPRTTLVWDVCVRRVELPLLDAQLVVYWEGRLPEWFGKIVASLDQIGHLPSNWDSYGAKPVRHSSILATVDLLLWIMRDDIPAPAVVPTNRGTVTLEWHTRGVDLEIEVLGRGRSHVVFEDSYSATQWEDDVGSDLKRLTECIERLSKAGSVGS